MNCRLLHHSVLLLCVALVGLATPSASADWLQFRGPDGSGISTDKDIPLEWGEKKNLKWKLEMPGKGFSSPVVVGKKVFVTCYTGAGGNLSDLKRTLVCVDRNEGKILWQQTVDAVLPEFQSRGGFAYHGYASSSPASDGERVYVVYGTTGVLAYDLEGKKLWQQSVGTELNARFGSSSSPIVYKDMVIVPACSESTSIRALDKKTGKELWKTVGGFLASSYSTPIVVQNKEGKDEILIPMEYETWSLKPEDGKLNWYIETNTDTSACTMLVHGDEVVYAVGGRNGGRTAFKIGGEKNVSSTNTVWKVRGGTYVSSPVLYKGHLYYADRNGSILAVDAKTGEEKGRVRTRGNYYASVIVVDDKLYAVSRFNGTYVFAANPELKELAHNSFDDESDTSGTPAIDDGQLFMRSDTYLYCVEKSK